MSAPSRDAVHAVSSVALKGASPAAVAGLEADLAFCHPAIRGVGAIDVQAGSVELLLDSGSGSGLPEDLLGQVEAVIQRSVRSYRFAEQTPPLWRHDAAARYEGGKAGLARFVERYTRSTGPGQTVLMGPAAELRDWLDARMRKVAAGVGAEAWHLPNMEMNDDLLSGTKYFASHPQLVSFGFHLPPHFQTIEAFAAAAKTRHPSEAADFQGVVPGFIMEPAVCHNIYRALRGERIAEGRAVTTLGHAYRYEGFRFQPLLRQWEYAVREIALAGVPAWVEDKRLRMVELTQALAVELDLDASLEVATDPFFVGGAASARAFQLMGSTKLELRLRIDEGSSIAGSSFNRHGRHFAEPMNILAGSSVSDAGDVGKVGDESADVADTACMGFGTERWMAAFVSRWGAEPARWPLGDVRAPPL